jgi:folate-binding protein YgfZ
VTDIGTQYRIITTAAGWIDKSGRARLRFDGTDRASFLQALVSNEVLSLGPGHGVYATYLTPQGRMISDLRIYNRGTFLLADVPAERAARLLTTFDSLVFAEDVAVSDISATLAQVSVFGRKAADAIAGALGLDAGALSALPLFGQIPAGDGFVARTDDADWPAFDLFIPAEVNAVIVRRLEDAGAHEISAELTEVLRIEAGRPSFGVDMTDETIPLEAGLLDRAISTSKGCYVGQEVIIRVLHRGGGRVAKRLVKIEFEPALTTPPAPGTTLLLEGRETGRVTSAAYSPARSRVVALGFVHRDAAVAGRQVIARLDAGDAPAEIVALAG